MLTLLLATTNPGKLAELRALLSNLAVNLLSPKDLDLDLAVEETGHAYPENAAIKARAFAATSGLPALADDSGLEVDALNGAPGCVPPALRHSQVLRMEIGAPFCWRRWQASPNLGPLCSAARSA